MNSEKTMTSDIASRYFEEFGEPLPMPIGISPSILEEEIQYAIDIGVPLTSDDVLDMLRKIPDVKSDLDNKDIVI